MLKLTTAALAALLIVPPVYADVVHQFHKRDGYWHHGSGFEFPRQIADFQLAGMVMQIDGNDDVVANYVADLNGQRQTAILELFYPTSAGAGAKPATARAAVQASVNTGNCKTTQSEKKITIPQHSEIAGTRITYKPKSAEGCSQATLYFFQTPRWVISVRTSTAATDADVTKALDAFVQALRWDSLDTDPTANDPAP